MPTYSYLCGGCGKSFELEQRISEDPIKQCALCGQPKARRQIVSGNFILKGGGWYSDGYGSSKKSSGSETPAKVDKVDTAAKPDKPDKKEGSSAKPEPSAAKGGESSSTKAAAAE
jgi:putative FmdB family regulatory protein